MLDAATKSRIDSARDILVGKVPDPKSQVEQITIALIYKFMDDMDRQSEELGGKASFFSDGYKKYAWHKLIDPRLSGHERLTMYAEGLEKMNENKHIPQLFRDIFKGAFLPYRDPETLNLFLKQINEFRYNHSEQLGDAFEYLLSVLGSQGDAGQFRTPRHIIDFIVSIVDPKKNETVLDPACGTAGFLISAYKHILTANSKDGKGDLLTGDERSRLMDNFCGYDISPDMVRLSRANMYLHGFPQPRIHEYDTLTSEERWDERYDVIMANPPFMTPKGGIRPHNRFSVKANRSEVLFVDYIAEHLNVNGRGGVIVPEGVIFQSQNSYKALRKMLVENYLWCVVSLPAGIFNPYSGVKTSILLMDKALAKRSNEILFVKIENDGFNLGAQRRRIAKNDLPAIEKLILDWKSRESTPQSALGHLVSRQHILETLDCSLSGDRYKESRLLISKKWPMVSIKELCKIDNGFAFKSDEYVSTGLRVIRIANVQKGKIVDSDPKFIAGQRSSEFERYSLNEGDLLVSLTGNVGRVGRIPNDLLPAVLNQRVARLSPKDSLHSSYLDLLLNYGPFEQDAIRASSGIAQLNLSTKWIADYLIPFPSPDVRAKIMTELDGYRKIIEGAKQVTANFKPTFSFDPSWKMAQLGDICQNLDGQRIPVEKGKRESGKYPYYGASGIVDYVAEYIFDGDFLLVSEDGANLLARVTPIAFSVSGKIWVNNHAHILAFADRSLQKFVETYLNCINLKDYVTGAAQPKLTQAALNRIPIPMPEKDVMTELVESLEVEQQLIDANRKLVEIYEQKIQDKLAEIWGEKEK